MLEKYNDVITISELCQILNVSKKTAYTLIRSGEIPAKRVKKLYRISKEDIISFLQFE